MTPPCTYRECSGNGRPAAGQWKVWPTGTVLTLCADCQRRLEATGLHLVPLTTGWVARAVRNELPPRVWP